MTRFDQLSVVAAAAALVWSLMIGVWIWTVPWLTEETAGGVVSIPFSAVSYWGPVPLLVPPLMASWALWAAWRQRIVGLSVATLLLLVFCVMGGFSIGPAYVPAGLCLIVSTGSSFLSRWRTRRRSGTSEAQSDA